MKEYRIKLSQPNVVIGNSIPSNYTTSVAEFEAKLQQIIPVSYVKCLSSGTAAIHLALLNLSIGEGDIVLVQSLTYVATANPIVYVGATPVFVGSESDSLNMCPEALETAIIKLSKLGKKPKAILYVHLYGMPADSNALETISIRYDIPLIEDAAEALGSTLGNQPCGTFGSQSILSFNLNKIVTTYGGGALLTNSEEYAQNAYFLSEQAKDDFPYYEHSKLGYNYRFPEVCATIGCLEIPHLKSKVNRRRAIYELYKKNLSEIESVQFLDEPSEAFSNRWLSTILIDPRIDSNSINLLIKGKLAEKGIETRVFWKPLHLQPLYKDAQYVGDDSAEDLFNRGLCLPSSDGLSDDQVMEVIDQLKEILIQYPFR